MVHKLRDGQDAIRNTQDAIRKSQDAMQKDIHTIKANLASTSRVTVQFINRQEPSGHVLGQVPLRDGTMPWGETCQLRTNAQDQPLITLAQPPRQNLIVIKDVLLPELKNLEAIESLPLLELACYFEGYCEHEGNQQLTEQQMKEVVFKA
ncbi:hypothetical protein PQX77_014870, partial [Marasmius sp. AFHP31]